MVKYELFLLAQKREFCEECVNILNEEWPRSATQRQRTIEKCLNSCPPMSLVFVDLSADKAVGHARVCIVPNEDTACWVESVVIRKSLRGIGLGKMLMQRLENTISQLGYKKVYLSTRDKESFYAKCGYTLSHPVVNVGAHSKILEKFPLALQENNDRSKIAITQHTFLQIPSVSVPPPPPPPPPPPSRSLRESRKILPDKLIYMCKFLT